jgi:hypothetical protein
MFLPSSRASQPAAFAFFAKSNRRILARPMEGRYYPALFASGLLILVTLIVAIFA